MKLMSYTLGFYYKTILQTGTIFMLAECKFLQLWTPQYSGLKKIDANIYFSITVQWLANGSERFRLLLP